MQTDHSALATSPGRPSGRWSWLAQLVGQRSVQAAAVGWVLANAVVLALGDGVLPFDRPRLAGATALDQVISSNLALLEVFFLMTVVWFLTRTRVIPDIAARTPARAMALRETLAVLGYGALGLLGGFLVGRPLGWHPFGFHLAGTLFGTHQHVAPAEAVGWAVYNVLVYAVIPYWYFHVRRGYSNTELNLTSSNRRNDILVIVVVLILESLAQLLVVSAAIFSLTPRQLALGLPLTFALYFLGTALPTLIFVTAILVPRYLKLTGSAATAIILGGLTYATMHLWDSWTALSSPRTALLSLLVLVMVYFGPGMMKSYLTVRTGNAWVHLWAYHAIAPHTLLDTPLLVRTFGIR